MNKIPDIHDKFDRLEFLMKKSDKKIADIADFIGLSREHLYRQIKSKKLSDERIGYILQYITDNKGNSGGGGDIGNITNATIPENHTNLIPYYDIDFIAGSSFEDKTKIPEYYMDIPEFRGCKAFRCYSDSMEQLIKSGNIVFGRRLEEWMDHLEYGQVYGIIMSDRRKYLKYIKKATEHHPKDYFSLVSHNPHYDTFEIPKAKIHSIWLIEGWMNKNT